MPYTDRYPRTRNGRRHPLDCVAALGYAANHSGLDDVAPYNHPAQCAAWLAGWDAYLQDHPNTLPDRARKRATP